MGTENMQLVQEFIAELNRVSSTMTGDVKHKLITRILGNSVGVEDNDQVRSVMLRGRLLRSEAVLAIRISRLIHGRSPAEAVKYLVSRLSPPIEDDILLIPKRKRKTRNRTKDEEEEAIRASLRMSKRKRGKR